MLAGFVMYGPNRILETCYARIDSNRILKNEGKVLFIDGGANLGQGVCFFASFFPPGRVAYDIFEPNPNCLEPLGQNLSCFESKAVRIHLAALSHQDGHARLFGIGRAEGGLRSTGASIKQYQHSIFYDASPEDAIRVPTVDFSKFLKTQSQHYDTIVVKLDIEGAENDLLEALIARDAIGFIDTLYVEFHSSLLKGPRQRAERQREARLIRQLKKSEVCFRHWH